MLYLWRSEENFLGISSLLLPWWDSPFSPFFCAAYFRLTILHVSGNTLVYACLPDGGVLGCVSVWVSVANAFTYWSHYLWSAQLSMDHHLSHDSFPKSERNIVDGEMGMHKRERLGEDGVKTVFWTGQEWCSHELRAGTVAYTRSAKDHITQHSITKVEETHEHPLLDD